MKEGELRGRLVAARNGLEYATIMYGSDDLALFRRSDLFCVHPKKPTEEHDPWLSKAIRAKSWQVEYLKRAQLVGLFEKITDEGQVRYELVSNELAQRIIDDFDEHGMLLTKLVVPSLVEVATDFDDAIAGRQPSAPDMAAWINDDEGEEVDEDVEVDPDQPINITAGTLGSIVAVVARSLEINTEMAKHLLELDEKLDSQAASITELTQLSRKRFGQVDNALGEVKSLANAAVARMSNISKTLEGGLSPDFSGFDDKLAALANVIDGRMGQLHSVVMDKLREAGVNIIDLHRAMGERKTLQKALDQLQSTRDDSAAAIDLLVSHLDKRGSDGEGS